MNRPNIDPTKSCFHQTNHQHQMYRYFNGRHYSFPLLVLSLAISSHAFGPSIDMLHQRLLSQPRILYSLSRPNLLRKPQPYRSFQSSSSTFYSSYSNDCDYDVIVIGGGHAGCEAAAAAARTGARTALLTQRLDTVGELSCNPSIGGIGKGHLVREVDALGGVMGEIADLSGIHFRMLNRRKGPAVRGPRAQMDRDLYKTNMYELMSKYENLSLLEGSAEDLLLDEGEGIESLTPFLDPVDKVTLLNSLREGAGSKNHNHNNGEDSHRLITSASSKATEKHRQARIRGVVVKKGDVQSEITARCVVITTGTFLRGVLMLGKERYSGGRHLRDSEQVEPPSVGLSQTLSRFGFPLGRLKTGTPPRLDGRTINWDVCDIQPTENPATPFSHIRQFLAEQPPLVHAGTVIDCYKTATNELTHKYVSEYAHLLPTYDGMDGRGNGPRYCPSLYKKVERFPDRTSHNSFLEPEGLNTHVVYPNGMSGPFPPEIQQKIMRTMRGLENVEIIRPGYDVEYDFVNPQSLTHTMETKKISGLFLAGQICGTTGYEEAAAQGIVAGANAGRAAFAARHNEAANPFILGRDESYIGVLIDDLVTKGTEEPYRMFTSRAEYRITLRSDNSDLRLTQKGAQYGLVNDDARISALESREMLIESRIKELREFKLFVREWAERGGNDIMGGDGIDRKGREGIKKSAEEILGMPHVTLDAVEKIIVDVQSEKRQHRKKLSTSTGDEVQDEDKYASFMQPSPISIYDTVEATIKYQSYIDRQSKDMESWRRAQGVKLPADIVYDHETLPSLSKEEIEKLNRLRPNTFAEASNISGLTPQSLVFLYHHVSKVNKSRDRLRSSMSEKLSA